MSEVYFYHLQHRRLEAVLPALLGRCLERGWRALVKLDSPERVGALDDRLWSFSDESFLPHGTDREPDPDDQPILLTTGDLNPNGAEALFLAEGAAPPPDLAPFRRVSLLIDGNEEAAVQAARAHWRAWLAAGHEVSYWQEDESGRWRKRR